jgi:hypothetical protein
MTDRTDHVLAAIDGALDDRSVSGDAMRWTPDAATVGAGRDGHYREEEDDWAEIPRAWSELVAQAGEELVRAFGQMAEAVQRIAVAWPRPVRTREQVDPTEADLARARALELRRTRHTGPARDLTRQKRPRMLP